MKRVIVFILVIVTLLLSSGCGQDTKLDEKLIIEGIGIDISNGNYYISIQAMNTQQSEAANSNGIVIGATGQTILDAMTNAVQKTGKSLLYSQNLFIILSEKACKNSLTDPLNFFIRYFQSRSSVDVFISKVPAQDIMSAESAQSIELLVNAEERSGRVIRSSLINIISAERNTTSDPRIPVLTLEKKKNITNVTTDGTAVFSKNKFAGYLNNDETLGALFILGKANNAATVCNGMSCYIDNSKSKVSVSVINGKITYTIDVNAQCNAFDTKKTIYDYDVRNAFQNRIYNLITEAINKSVGDYSADIFEFGKLLLQKEPAKYNSISNFSDALKNASFDISVKVKPVA
ncbi:MAG: Ger(x)C family spore germination protein [Bacillota bacterium]|nr:Ger(x)C family spore germination protein [Bacillota bacterium]